MAALSAEEARRRLTAIAGAFSPAAPIARRDLFAGRTDQLTDLMDVAAQTGQHAVIYGERGVGKTSLAAVVSALWRAGVLGSGRLSTRVNCDGTDSFSSVWKKVFGQMRWAVETRKVGFDSESRETIRSAAELLPEDDPITPGHITGILDAFSEVGPPLVFIDEFDRIEEPASRALFADTIKTLSDQLIGATIVLVGVADNVDELIEEHQSVERALAQIRMPRMSADELAEIVARGLAQAEMAVEPQALGRITQLSQGLPHYTHLLAQAAARAAIGDVRSKITALDVNRAITGAIERAQQSILRSYHQATSSARETLYPHVLLACALAKGDSLGYFAAVNVRGPLSTIMDKRVEIPVFSGHLHALSEPGRGCVLQKTGGARRYRFRFTNPLLQPFVTMRGLADGLITERQLQGFAG